ncbi:DNA gyrase C-terminal beta-propeller domain-containing protein, partial [Arthrospira platensis SPKY2]
FKDYDPAKLVSDEDFIIIATEMNYIKKVKSVGKVQKRGGRGVSYGKLKDGDIPIFVDKVNSTDLLLMFTEDGYLTKVNTYDIPTTSLQNLGTNLSKILNGKKLVAL